MARQSKLPSIQLSDDQKNDLEKIARSRVNPASEVERANIILLYAAGKNITSIKKTLGMSRPTIYKCIEKTIAAGPESGLKDLAHSPKKPEITEQAKAWVINLACTKPKDHGYAAEVWSQSKLAAHTRTFAPSAGHTCLKQASKATIHRILKAQPLHPHKIKYYLEKRDPDFERKMQEILLVYQDVNFQNDEDSPESGVPEMVTVSVDEKPGVQAIQNIAADLPPVAGKYPEIGRDYEYKRLGTVSFLAALDLHTGHVTAQVHDRHRSREFILLLNELDEYYPPECIIRVILDNHSSHISKETMTFLTTKPNRFVYVHTPKHGSWLNLVETLFGKMARTFLRHIRVGSKEEIKERIMKGVAEINSNPVVHRWNKFSETPVA